eukprot:764417-Hanusia_phi.AAC.6
MPVAAALTDDDDDDDYYYCDDDDDDDETDSNEAIDVKVTRNQTGVLVTVLLALAGAYIPTRHQRL